MAEYLRPDVYVHEVSTGEKPIQAVSTSTGAFIGLTARGPVNEPVLVTSWTEFVNKFAGGLNTPFIKEGDLPNAVYGFFQNGGSRAYIVRTASASSVKAQGTLGEELVFHAKDEGAWANDVLSVVVATGVGNTYNVTVKMGSEIVEVYEGLVNDSDKAQYFVDVINQDSSYISFSSEVQGSLTAGTVTFSKGDDALASISNSDHIKGLNALDLVQSVNLVAMPGLTDEAIASALVGYCDTRNECFAIVDAPVGSTVESVQEYRNALGGTNGAVYFPNIKISDPLGRTTSSLKVCPPSGHIMGIFARTDANRGVYKAPAGEEAVVRGAVALETQVPFGAVDVLNPLGVNCIIAKPNAGIVVWGARSLSHDPAKRYVSDVRYDLMIRNSIYAGTQWAVFEPNDEQLWDKIDTSLRGFLDEQWKSGALRGGSADEAYYVKCDSELNNDLAIANGQVVAEIGYAKQKPAEFVIVKIVQKSAE